MTSSTTHRRDRNQKRSHYVAAGIAEYWIVDGDERTVTVVRPLETDALVRDTLLWSPGGATAPLDVSLAELFGSEE